MFHPNLLVIGEPGSGKTVGTAQYALAFPGAVVALDPHSDSLSMLLLEHAAGDILFDRISDTEHALGYGLLRPSRQASPEKRQQQNQRRAEDFVEVMMRRQGGGDIASTPLKEEMTLGAILLHLHQFPAKPPELLPYAFMPGTDEYRALIRDCELPELRHKFGALAAMTPRALRSEVGGAARLVQGVFRKREFIVRCRDTFAVGAHLQRGGSLFVERGEADADVTRTVLCGIARLVTEHCENRGGAHPPVLLLEDECTNASLAGDYEQKKAGETRKVGQPWGFICQHPNFPCGAEGFFQNCQEKHLYRTGDFTLARKLAGFVVPYLPQTDSRSALTDSVAADLMNFKPGWRWVVGRGGARREYVPLLKSGWVNWPGLREAKLREKLEAIWAMPEYRASTPPSSGGRSTPSSSASSPSSPPPPPSSRSSSAAERWKRARGRRGGGS